MDSNVPDEAEKSYHIARLNWEKSERAAGQLARFLAHQTIASRLVMIAAERSEFGAHVQLESPAPSGTANVAVPPLPYEVREALTEMRAWRAATFEAYKRLPSAKRSKMPRPVWATWLECERRDGARLA